MAPRCAVWKFVCGSTGVDVQQFSNWNKYVCHKSCAMSKAACSCSSLFFFARCWVCCLKARLELSNPAVAKNSTWSVLCFLGLSMTNWNYATGSQMVYSVVELLKWPFRRINTWPLILRQKLCANKPPLYWTRTPFLVTSSWAADCQLSTCQLVHIPGLDMFGMAKILGLLAYYWIHAVQIWILPFWELTHISHEQSLVDRWYSFSHLVGYVIVPWTWFIVYMLSPSSSGKWRFAGIPY